MDKTIVWDANMIFNIIHITIQIDQILGDSSTAEDGSDKVLEVSPPL